MLLACGVLSSVWWHMISVYIFRSAVVVVVALCCVVVVIVDLRFSFVAFFICVSRIFSYISYKCISFFLLCFDFTVPLVGSIRVINCCCVLLLFFLSVIRVCYLWFAHTRIALWCLLSPILIYRQRIGRNDVELFSALQFFFRTAECYDEIQ